MNHPIWRTTTGRYSTNQTREAGVWLADVLRRHGGDQRLVAPVENHDELLDMQLDVKDGLLTIECQYPSDKDLEELPRVWLTDNEKPWDPKILDQDDSIRVPSCWDGESEFIAASNEIVQEQEMNRFDSYVLQFLLQNQVFPPVSTAGECKQDKPETSSAKAKLVLSMMSRLDSDVASAFEEESFRASMMKFYSDLSASAGDVDST